MANRGKPNGTAGAHSWRPPLVAFQLVLMVVAVVIIWQLKNLLLLVLGAVLIGIVFDTLAQGIRSATELPRRFALPLGIVVIALVLAGFGVLLGTETVGELSGLFQSVPEAAQTVSQQFGIEDLEGWVSEELRSLVDGSLLRDISATSTSILYQFLNAVLIVIGGVFLAANPGLYRDGMVRLMPRRWRKTTDETLTATTHALRYWMLGQLLSMLCVGILTTIGLYLLNVPSALALGFLAGLLDFVPYFGPIVAAVPAVAMSLAESPVTALWVAGLYLLVQQIESALIVPLIQRRAVHLPPALTVFSILGFGILLGPWGVVFGAPLTVIAMAVVKKLWLEEPLFDDQAED